MSKPITQHRIPVKGRRKKRMSSQELELREYNKQVRALKLKCSKNFLELYSYSDALFDNFICVLSKNEYEIELDKADCEPNNDSYFLSPHDFEEYIEL